MHLATGQLPSVGPTFTSHFVVVVAGGALVSAFSWSALSASAFAFASAFALASSLVVVVAGGALVSAFSVLVVVVAGFSAGFSAAVGMRGRKAR
jgi:hypothetical protein